MFGGSGYSVFQGLLKRGVVRRFPDLSREELDFMVRVATSDFRNYIMVVEDLLYEEGAEGRALARITHYGEEEPEYLALLLSDWLDVWEWKWRQRVKLDVDSGKNVEDEVSKAVAPVVGGIKNYEWFKKFALGSLVKAGEVCFTDTLADSAVKTALYDIVKGSSPGRAAEIVERNPMVLVEGIVKKVRMFQRFKGGLVVVRLNPEFFRQRGMAEWW